MKVTHVKIELKIVERIKQNITEIETTGRIKTIQVGALVRKTGLLRRLMYYKKTFLTQ